ncbi:MAG: potassium/proton antiporter [Bacteroidaceae bacterium]|nr:potassium/proton antiporter [Bacteroidaceae bacterium]
MSLEFGLLVGAILIYLSILISKTGFKFGIPTLLLFLLVGMAFGTDGIGLQFDDARSAQFIGMVAMSIILFTGGLDTKLKDIRPVAVQGILLSTIGVLLTTVITGCFIFFLSNYTRVAIALPLLTCMLLAATMSSTDSASVFSLLRSQHMNLKQHLKPMLELESGSNDPMAYMLTIVLIDIINSGEGISIGNVLWGLLVQFVLGGLIGFLIGKYAVKLINRINLPNSSLYPILLLSLVFITFTVTDFANGNGYLAVYIAGMVVGNNKLTFCKEINTFMDGMTWLFQIIMFLILGLLVNPHEMLDVTVAALLIAAFMMLVARPLSVYACLLPFKKFNNKARVFTSWVGLRGATPIIFATYPVIASIEGSNQLFNIVFFITLLSLLIQGMTIAKVARCLQLDLPEEKTGNDFGVELPDEIDSKLEDLTLTAEMLQNGNRLADMNLPKGMLVMIIKRGTQFIVPNGKMELLEGDKLLVIKDGNLK